jgi:hypothetical protein
VSENPGGPIDSWPEERPFVRYTTNEARKGKPGHRVKSEPKWREGKLRSRQAEEYCERESPPDADGESYQE